MTKRSPPRSARTSPEIIRLGDIGPERGDAVVTGLSEERLRAGRPMVAGTATAAFRVVEMTEGELRLRALPCLPRASPTIDLERHAGSMVRTSLPGVAGGGTDDGARLA